MKVFNILMALIICGSLTACTSRNTIYPDEVNSDVSTNWHVHDIQVSVPDSLTTSDVNILQPNVDIVWHGDPQGDRRAQVATILRDALAAAQKLIPENMHRPVVLQATLIQFHSLTPRARSVIGGVHKISFMLQVVDQKTGEILAGPAEIEADEFAYGGWEAVRADAEGQSMKVRISNRIAQITGIWLGLVAEDDQVAQGKIYAIGR